MARKKSSYISNIGKSVKFSMKEALEQRNPAISGFASQNQEFFDNITETLKQLRSGQAKISQLFKLDEEDQKMLDMVKATPEKMAQQLKTGDFTISEEDEMKALGFDMEDLDFGDDNDIGLDESIGDMKDLMKDIKADTDGVTPLEKTTATVGQAQLAATQENTKTIAQVGTATANAISTLDKHTQVNGEIFARGFANTNKIQANIAFNATKIQEALHSQSMSALNTVNENLVNIVNFNNNIIGKYTNEATTYYNDSMAEFRRMREALERAYPDPSKEQQRRETPYEKLRLGTDSIIDLSAYTSQIKENFLNTGAGSALSSFLNPMVLGQILSNPMGFLMTQGIDSLMSTALKKSMEGFNKNIKSFIPALLGKLSRTGEESSNSLYSFLGEVFGIRPGSTEKDLAKYNKKAVPFDGMTQRAITFVIPSYLAEIVHLLGGQKSVYEYDKGKFANLQDVKDRVEADRQSDARNAYDYDVRSELESLIKNLDLGEGDWKKKRQQLNEGMEGLLYELAKSRKNFINIHDPREIGNIVSTKFKEKFDNNPILSYEELEDAFSQLSKLLSNRSQMQLASIAHGYAANRNNRFNYTADGDYSYEYAESNFGKAPRAKIKPSYEYDEILRKEEEARKKGIKGLAEQIKLANERKKIEKQLEKEKEEAERKGQATPSGSPTNPAGRVDLGGVTELIARADTMIGILRGINVDTSDIVAALGSRGQGTIVSGGPIPPAIPPAGGENPPAGPTPKYANAKKLSRTTGGDLGKNRTLARKILGDKREKEKAEAAKKAAEEAKRKRQHGLSDEEWAEWEERESAGLSINLDDIYGDKKWVSDYRKSQKEYDAEKREEKEEEERDKETFFDRLVRVLRSPMDAVASAIDSVGNIMHDILFGDEDEKGILDHVVETLKEGFQGVADTIAREFWDPLKRMMFTDFQNGGVYKWITGKVEDVKKTIGWDGEEEEEAPTKPKKDESKEKKEETVDDILNAGHHANGRPGGWLLAPHYAKGKYNNIRKAQFKGQKFRDTGYFRDANGNWVVASKNETEISPAHPAGTVAQANDKKNENKVVKELLTEGILKGNSSVVNAVENLTEVAKETLNENKQQTTIAKDQQKAGQKAEAGEKVKGIKGYIKKYFGEVVDNVSAHIFGDNKDENGKQKPVMTQIGDMFAKGARNFSNYFFGNKYKDEQETVDMFKANMKKAIPSGIGRGIVIGGGLAGASLTGGFGVLGSLMLPGGPIGSMIVGLGAGLALENKRFREWLFGTEDAATKEFKGGKLSSVANFVKKNQKAILGGAAIGLLNGITGGGLIGSALGALPLGLGALPMLGISILGPMTVSIGAAMALKSDRMQTLLFGKPDPDGKNGEKIGGSMNTKAMKTLHDRLPNIAVGAGLSAAASLVFGNVGILGGLVLGPWHAAILGGAIGFGLSSKRFREALFGKQDEDGNFVKGGLVDKIQLLLTHEIINPFRSFMNKEVTRTKNWFLKDVFLPLKKAVPVYKMWAKDMLTKATEGIKTIFDNLGKKIEKALGPIGKFIRKAVVSMIDGVRKSVGGTLHTMLSFASGLLTAPIKLLAAPAKYKAEQYRKNGTDEQKAEMARIDSEYAEEEKSINAKVAANTARMEALDTARDARREYYRDRGYEPDEKYLRLKTRAWKKRQEFFDSFKEDVSDKLDEIAKNTHIMATGEAAPAPAVPNVTAPIAAASTPSATSVTSAVTNIAKTGKGKRSKARAKAQKLNGNTTKATANDIDQINKDSANIRTEGKKEAADKSKFGGAVAGALGANTGENPAPADLGPATKYNFKRLSGLVGRKVDKDSIDRDDDKNRAEYIVKARSEEDYRQKILGALSKLKETGKKGVEKTKGLIESLLDFLKGGLAFGGLLALLKSIWDILRGKSDGHDTRIVRDAAQIATRKAMKAISRFGKPPVEAVADNIQERMQDAAMDETKAGRKTLGEKVKDKARAAKDWVKGKYTKAKDWVGARWVDGQTLGENMRNMGRAVKGLASEGLERVGNVIGNSAPVRLLDDVALGLKYGPSDRIVTDAEGRTHHMRFDRHNGWQEVTGLGGSEFRDLNWMREQERLAGRGSTLGRVWDAGKAWDAAKYVGGGIKSGANAIGEGLQSAAEKLANTDLYRNVTAIPSGIKQIASQPINAVKAGANAVAKLPEQISEWAANDETVQFYKNAVGEKIDNFKANIAEQKANVTEAWTDTKKFLADTSAGKKVVGGYEWFMEKAKGAIDAICNNSTVKKFLGEGASGLASTLGKKVGSLTKEAFKAIAGKIAKAAAKTGAMIGSAGIAQAVFTCYDAYSGLNDAAELWGVNPEDLTPGMKTAAVIMNVIMGLGPMVWVDLALEAIYLGTSMLMPQNPINIKREVLMMIYENLPNVEDEDVDAVKKMQEKANTEYEDYVNKQFMEANNMSKEEYDAIMNSGDEEKIAALKDKQAKWLETADVKSKDEYMHEKNENYSPVMDAIRANPVGGWLFGYNDENGKFHKGVFSRMKDGLFGTGETDENGNVDEGLWGKAKEYISNFASIVGKFFKGAWDLFSGAYDWLFNKNTDEKIETVWKLIIGGKNDAGEYELGIIPKVYGYIKDTFTNLGNSIMDFGGKILDIVLAGDIKGGFRLVGNMIDGFFGTNLMGNEEANGLISESTKSVGEFFSEVYDSFEKGKNWMFDLFDKIIHLDFKGISQMLHGLFDIPSEENLIAGLWKKATGAIGDFFTSLWNKFVDLYKWWKDFDLKKTIVNKLTELFPKASQAIKDTLNFSESQADAANKSAGGGGGSHRKMINITPGYTQSNVGGGGKLLPMPEDGYKQTDAELSSTLLYGNNRNMGTMGELGCMPTGVATALTSVGIPTDPNMTKSVLTSNDFADNGSGVLPSALPKMVETFGGSFTPLDPKDKTSIQRVIDAGGTMITGGSNADGISTAAGHYNVIVNGKTMDPLGRKSRKVNADDIMRTVQSKNGKLGGVLGVVQGNGGHSMHPGYKPGVQEGAGAGNKMYIGAQSGNECTNMAAAAVWNAYTGENNSIISGWYNAMQGAPLYAKPYNYSNAQRAEFEAKVAEHFTTHPDYPIMLYQTGGDGNHGGHTPHPLNRVSGNHATVIGRKMSDGQYQIFDSNGGTIHTLQLNQIFDETAKGSSQMYTDASEANMLMIPTISPSAPITEWGSANGAAQGSTVNAGSTVGTSVGGSKSSPSGGPLAEFMSKVGIILGDYYKSVLTGTTYTGSDLSGASSNKSSAGSAALGGTAPVTGQNAKDIWNYLSGPAGFSKEDTAAIMGNFEAESGLDPMKVEGGSRSDTLTWRGSPGYGLAQWTYPSRQDDLVGFANQKGKSVSDLGLQLEFFDWEAKNKYSGAISKLKSASGIDAKTDAWCTHYEGPDERYAHRDRRKDSAHSYFNQFANGGGGLGLRRKNKLTPIQPYKFAGYAAKVGGGGDSATATYELRPNSGYSSAATRYVSANTSVSNTAVIDAIRQIDIHSEMRELIAIVAMQVKNQHTINANMINAVKAVSASNSKPAGGATGGGSASSQKNTAKAAADAMKKLDSPQTKPDGPNQQSKKGISGTNNYNTIHAKNIEIAKGGKFAV